MSERDMSSAKTLVAIEKARKLLNRAYDSGSLMAERTHALKIATKTLKEVGLTVDDLKEQSTPDYLTKIKARSGEYDPARGVKLAQSLAKSGWKHQDPRKHGYVRKNNEN